MDEKPQRARLTVIYCDQCGRIVDQDAERDHWHGEQCGGCGKYRKRDADWGWCENRESIYCGRLMFEHDGCSKWVQGQW
jgi:hypothetical protein